MAEFVKKQVLDYEGLKDYDKLIKEYIKEQSASNDTITEIENNIAEITEAQSELSDKIDVLNGDKTVEGSVANIVENSVQGAVESIVDGAPEAFDTLKELADWIKNDETASAELIARVNDAEQAIEDLRVESEKSVQAVYDSIQRITEVEIQGLFPVLQADDQTAVQAIASVEAGGAVKLTADQTISENVTINKDCYIDANGSTFTGIVTIPADAEVIIENATFVNPVIVA